ncbi:hybrid non-ribosomal peptide synthetase/type I polyketide synthase [Pseudoxanthomonas wuyuanensis]|uniref:Amino acid adenylation domain-containing protein n=1 Tax=Pseudoxanthomonas wuyuanensis TaxID=1073196 RepID=A0A286D9G8_9GAMM|nr:hybrid non-ribosomal peptide synthetase/type I polyketide synthase [Pseudoxanthomonas wuyuanensis]KAF1721993.1 type I polyketide synthase [Pseudoxanthomonas wuyuanensis]SOD55272.1 amino acid adenylation domain-containing protein [Pseudoxanthomonas wuyuanensis]
MNAFDEKAGYWRSLLAGVPMRLELPVASASAAVAADSPPQPRQADAGELEAWARQRGATFADVALVLWASVFARLTGQLQIVVGVDGIAAPQPAGEHPVLLPLRVDFSETATLEQLLQSISSQRVQSGLHADVPADMFDGILPAMDAAAGPRFQIGFASAPGALADSAIGMGVEPDEDGWRVEVHARDPQACAGSQRLRGYWDCLLHGLLADRQIPVLQLPLMADEQMRQLAALGNDTAVDYPPAEAVQQLFEMQAARTPDARAVVQDGRSLSYAQLNAQANQLARHLRGLGIGVDDRIAIYADRGIEMVLGLLAVLKAGAAYVPLDPTYPAERLAYTVQDSEPSALLTQSGMETDWRQALGDLPPQLPVIDLASATPEWAAQPAQDLPPADLGLTAERLAYVLYTSGSTGTPKGVAMPHGPLINLIQWQIRQPGSDLPRRTLQFAALGFDVAFQEVLGTLASGGELHLIDQQTRLSAGKLFDFIVEHRIERMFLPYFALQMLAEGMENRASALPDGQAVECALREVITAGEQLRIEPKIARFFQRLPGCRLHNHYGPTETHVVTALTLPEDPDSWPRLPSIGRPIANARVYLLDPQGQPVPEGVVGELYLAGPVVARGYLKRPDLSAERFVPDPFREQPQARMYRTGDIGRWLPDGNLELLGRKDFQVKIRGFRVELGEIEAQIMAHPGVREAGVLAREDTPGLKRLVAYFAPLDAEKPVDVEALRHHLIAQLPDYMIPVAYVQMDALPLSPNGKLDRGRLPAPGRHRPDWAGAYEPPRDATEAALCRILAEALDLESMGRNDNFFDLGGSSLLAVRVLEGIRREGLGDVPTMALFRDPTPAALAQAIRGGGQQAIEPSRMAAVRRGDHDDPIAIIAMAGRFPGAADTETFWQNLCEGRDTVSRFALEDIDPGVAEATRRDPLYVPARGIFDDVDKFDAAFFGISPKEAELMDPQQRVFLELCWECIERAGHVPDASPVPVGVFAGMYNASYYQHNVLAHPDLIDKVGAFQVMLGNEKDYIATRVAHKLNLTGPAISVHTACSTSLVAIAQAVDSLRAGRCGMALAGGIAVTCPVRSGHLYQEGGMLSADGHTRSFDADATGTVFSDGAAVVLLKRLSDAIADGNPVYAVIRGVAVNNDGGNKASFTAPSSEGQAAVIAMAQVDAGAEPRSIGYVETHGTATPLGDPIEIEGLSKAFRRGTDDSGFCVVGSVKSNIGHTLMAAGAAGVIKTALALQHELIPATAHFNQPNPVIDFARSPFVASGQTLRWQHEGRMPRRAGVSSFGVGGTNAHVVMEQAPALADSEPATGPQLLVLSARSQAALGQAVAQLADHLDAHDDNLADVAWTLAAGRKAFGHRVAIAAADRADAVARLRSAETAAQAARSRPAHAGEVVFLFPGQGCQYAGMGREIYRNEPVFRDAFDRCVDELKAELKLDLGQIVFGDDAEAMLPTAIMQPAIFSFEYALAQWWLSQGLTPVAMIGHSVGEFVAATLAGVFSLADALRLVARRGRMMQAQPSGAMLSVRLSLEDLTARLPASLSLAAENAPGACVVAGSHEAVAALQAQLESDGIACRALKTSHAFHSAMMEPVVEGFRAEVAAMPRNPPALPIVSTASGQWLDADTAVSPDYWARHLREPVRFSSALSQVLASPARVLLEIGPRATLTTLARQQPALQKHRIAAVASLADNVDGEHLQLTGAAGQLWCAGAPVDPARLDRRQRRRRLRLPTYPFEKKRYWVEQLPAAVSNVVPHPTIAARATLETLMPVASEPVAAPITDRKPRLVAQLKEVFEDVAGFDLSDADGDANFIELGLDSLMLTQVALQLQKTFPVKITFRQLMGEYASLERLTQALDAQLPPEAAPAAQAISAAPTTTTVPATPVSLPPAPVAVPASGMALPMAAAAAVDGDALRSVIAQQMQLMSQQLALLAASGTAPVAAASNPPAVLAAVAAAPANVAASSVPAVAPAATAEPAAPVADEEAALAHTRYDVKKAFGAIARIDAAGTTELNPHQRSRLDAFMRRYVARTPRSKQYTQQHRAHMADPRVVTGFRPLTKEIVYQIVVERSKGSHVWDIDGHEYVDALNGFGTSLFGWQPEFVTDAVKRQLEAGYEIGPQHPLAGEVAQLVCELTGHERAALCNTGSEAVLGAMRIARTVTGRDTIVLFSGSYHGINDEVIVRGTKKLRAVPAAPGILRNTAENVLVLDYGTPETLQIIRERAHELAAVLVEPVQSRRPDFQPVEFLQEVRRITAEAGAALIFDEVITGFRSHPGGAQALFGIKADLATYGKVVGGGYPIGVMAGKREFMDALDGGFWQYGDASVPTVGVTYFAGTFVRHPLTLAAAKASLEHMKREGAALQQRLNERTAAMAGEINAFCEQAGAPVRIKHFASLWRTHFDEDHPLQDLLFAMMRSRGIHILDNFPCFFTTAHSEADFQAIIQAYKESVQELQEAELLPRKAATSRTVMDGDKPAVPGARLGRDPEGRPAWYVPNPDSPGQYLKVGA